MASIPVPVLTTPEDVSLPVPGGPDLKAWHWRSEHPRGILVISHGLGEHSGIYRSLAEYLVAVLGIDVLGVDFLGHGRSPGRRGYVLRYDLLIDNLDAALRWAERRRPGLPRFLLGHSNGGVVATQTLLRNPSCVDGLILSNPAFRLRYQPPKHKVAVGHLLRMTAPWLTLSGPLPTESLTRDPLQRSLLRADLLTHTRISAPLYFGMLLAGQQALHRASELSMPLLLILGTDDPIIDPDSGRSFFDRFGGADKDVLAPEGFLHDPICDRDRGLIYHGLASWLLPRRSPAASGTDPGADHEGENSAPLATAAQPGDA